MKPEELKYNASHEWVGMTEEGGQSLAVIGISAFALEQLTDLVYMELPKVGQQVTAGEEFGEVESVKAVSPLYSPISGEVVAVHRELIDDLERLGQDPYGEGWIVKVKPAADASLEHLLDFAAYQEQCAGA